MSLSSLSISEESDLNSSLSLSLIEDDELDEMKVCRDLKRNIKELSCILSPVAFSYKIYKVQAYLNASKKSKLLRSNYEPSVHSEVIRDCFDGSYFSTLSSIHPVSKNPLKNRTLNVTNQFRSVQNPNNNRPLVREVAPERCFPDVNDKENDKARRQPQIFSNMPVVSNLSQSAFCAVNKVDASLESSHYFIEDDVMFCVPPPVSVQTKDIPPKKTAAKGTVKLDVSRVTHQGPQRSRNIPADQQSCNFLQDWSLIKKGQSLFLQGTLVDVASGKINKKFVTPEIIARPSHQIVRTAEGKYKLGGVFRPDKSVPEAVRKLIKENIFPRNWRSMVQLWEVVNLPDQKSQQDGNQDLEESVITRSGRQIQPTKKYWNCSSSPQPPNCNKILKTGIVQSCQEKRPRNGRKISPRVQKRSEVKRSKPVPELKITPKRQGVKRKSNQINDSMENQKENDKENDRSIKKVKTNKKSPLDPASGKKFSDKIKVGSTKKAVSKSVNESQSKRKTNIVPSEQKVGSTKKVVSKSVNESQSKSKTKNVPSEQNKISKIIEEEGLSENDHDLIPRCSSGDLFEGPSNISSLVDFVQTPIAAVQVLNSARRIGSKMGRITPPTPMELDHPNFKSIFVHGNSPPAKEASVDKKLSNKQRNHIVERVAKAAKCHNKKLVLEKEVLSQNTMKTSREVECVLEAVTANRATTPNLLKQVFRGQRGSDVESDNSYFTDEDSSM